MGTISLGSVPFQNISQDQSGRSDFSIVVTFRAGAEGSMVIYPNPVKESFTIQTSAAFMKVKTRLFDMNGRLIKTFLLSADNLTVNMNDVEKGVYLIKFPDGSVAKITKQ